MKVLKLDYVLPFNFKFTNKLKSGELVILYILFPKLFIDKKGSFKAKLQLSFNFFNAATPIKNKILNRQRKRLLLVKFFAKVWFWRLFLARVVFFLFQKLKVNVILFYVLD